jgi:hypothetical protein
MVTGLPEDAAVGKPPRCVYTDQQDHPEGRLDPPHVSYGGSPSAMLHYPLRKTGQSASLQDDPIAQRERLHVSAFAE